MTRKEQYRLYLRSEHWRMLRARKLESVGGKCERCGKATFLQVHHRIYREHFEDALMSDLEALCVYCHAKEHGKPVEIPTAWLDKERIRFRRKHSVKAKKQKPKWVQRMRSKAALNRQRKLEEIRARNDYHLQAFRERMNIIVRGG